MWINLVSIHRGTPKMMPISWKESTQRIMVNIRLSYHFSHHDLEAAGFLKWANHRSHSTIFVLKPMVTTGDRLDTPLQLLASAWKVHGRIHGSHGSRGGSTGWGWWSGFKGENPSILIGKEWQVWGKSWKTIPCWSWVHLKSSFCNGLVQGKMCRKWNYVSPQDPLRSCFLFNV